MKKCRECEIEKPLDQFYRQKGTKDGLRTQCKTCLNAKTNAYNAKNRAKINENARNRRKEDPEGHKNRVKAYREANRDKIREQNRINQRKWKEKPVNRAVHCLRSRLVDCITKGTKSAGTMELLGCSAEEFQKHISSQFTKGMSWDNYGDWHIDHIRPVASFDMTDPKQQRECFHWTNLQPLWAMDNWKKSKY